MCGLTVTSCLLILLRSLVLLIIKKLLTTQLPKGTWSELPRCGLPQSLYGGRLVVR
jgi:hypothetical protein